MFLEAPKKDKQMAFMRTRGRSRSSTGRQEIQIVKLR